MNDGYNEIKLLHVVPVEFKPQQETKPISTIKPRFMEEILYTKNKQLTPMTKKDARRLVRGHKNIRILARDSPNSNIILAYHGKFNSCRKDIVEIKDKYTWTSGPRTNIVDWYIDEI